MNAITMKTSTASTITTASDQWANRPNDERFTNLIDLHAFVDSERQRSKSTVVSSRRLVAQPDPQNPMRGLQIAGPNGNAAVPSNWAFGQLAAMAGVPAAYARRIPAPLAADCINYGLHHERDIEDIGVLLTGQPDGLPELRAATGPKYGRIWNSDITRKLVHKFGDGVTGDWKVPGEFGREITVTKANTTLFASDRDMFVFLADEENRIEMPNRRNGKPGSLARGFFVWNSEVGDKTLGVAFFMFDYVCANRIVWGAQGYTEYRLRHTVSAPDRWLEDVEPILIEYSKASALPVQETIAAAQAKKIDKVEDFLRNRFSARMSAQIMEAHVAAEGRPIETIWDATTGVTEFAKTIPHQDERIKLERAGGAILDLVAV